MNADISIYTIALEWIRVPHYALPAVIAGLALLGVVFLRNSRVAAIKTKQAAIRKARHRVEQIEDCLDLGLRELHSAVPDDRWEPSGRESLSEVPRKPIIDPRTDERCRDLI